MMLEHVHLRMWRFAKGVPYGTLLWFDERKEVPELYKLEAVSDAQCRPLDSELEVPQLDLPFSVSA